MNSDTFDALKLTSLYSCRRRNRGL